MSHQARQRSAGISNRETPAEEANEREEFPPLEPGPAAAEEQPESMPSARKVSGAYGREGEKPEPSDRDGSMHPSKSRDARKDPAS